MKRLMMAAMLIAAGCAWADAPVQEHSVAAERVEAAQLRANMAWRALDKAKFETKRARQDVLQAERVDREARKHAQAADQNLSKARARLAAAEKKQAEAQADLQRNSGTLDRLWDHSARPR